ncbi:helix-turn-helix transcriptional regulator [Methylobacterium sp. D54C]
MTDTARHVVPFQAAARELGLSAATLRRMCKDGNGPTLLRLSERRLGVRRGDLDAWLKTREVGAEQV